MTGKTAVEAWRQMYHELKEASESRDAAYEKVITELREELCGRTADLETAQAQRDAAIAYNDSKDWYRQEQENTKLEARLEAVDGLLFGTDEPLEHPVDIDALNDLFRKLQQALERKE